MILGPPPLNFNTCPLPKKTKIPLPFSNPTPFLFPLSHSPPSLSTVAKTSPTPKFPTSSLSQVTNLPPSLSLSDTSLSRSLPPPSQSGMAHTRGGRSDTCAKRRKQTMSTRVLQEEQRQRLQHVPEAAHENPTHVEITHEDPAHDQVGDEAGAVHQDQDTIVPLVSFPGGPEDTSVLITYGDHVATRLWLGDDRGEMKVINHGKSVVGLHPHAEIAAILRESLLEPLSNISYKVIDKGLICAFVERWQPDTSIFHLPVGEMTVSLDDVSQILHIPVMGAFFTMPTLDKETAVVWMHELLGVSMVDAQAEVDKNRGPTTRLDWLQSVVYPRCCRDEQWDMAARAFLLHLVGSTIFADKSQSLTRVAYLAMFRDLGSVHIYSWGAMALAFMYDQLREASKHRTRQMASYMTLLQAWIYEHFQGAAFGTKELEPGYQEARPRACRWRLIRGAGLVEPYRHVLDRMTEDEVSWDPYADHIEEQEFQPICLFRGFIRFGPMMHSYLPDRVLRQFGYMQRIPESPRDIRWQSISPREMDNTWLHFDEHVIEVGQRAIQPADVEPGYMEWFCRISHPYIYPQNVPAPVRAPAPGPPPEPAPPLEDARWARVYEIAQTVINRRLVQSNTEGGDLMHELLRLARPPCMTERTYVRHKRHRLAQ